MKRILWEDFVEIQRPDLLPSGSDDKTLRWTRSRCYPVDEIECIWWLPVTGKWKVASCNFAKSLR